jgi:hypothetical protein
LIISMSALRSGTWELFQYTLPSASTAIVMFSGLVCVAMLAAFGSDTLTVLVITGIVIRKMISSTSITSTRGVVLIVEIAPSSDSCSDPTLIDMTNRPLCQTAGKRTRRDGGACEATRVLSTTSSPPAPERQQPAAGRRAHR